jgi:transcriptional regulator with XRE-family HTH domain
MARASDAISNLRLQGYRRLGLTQEQLAEQLARLAWEQFGVRVGVDAQMVSKWERGEKRPSRFYRQLLCLLYDCSAGDLAWTIRPRLTSCPVPMAWSFPPSAPAGVSAWYGSARPPCTTWRR